jgi:hypothetical protein
MADLLSVTASIIAVLQLSSIVLRYLVDVNDLLAIAKALSARSALPVSPLNKTVDDVRVSDETWSATIRLFEDLDDLLNVLTTTL